MFKIFNFLLFISIFLNVEFIVTSGNIINLDHLNPALSFTLQTVPQSVTVHLGQSSKVGYVGIVEEIHGASPVAAFKGIPYAKPPVGELRYKPPVGYIERELRNASVFGPPCLQWDLFNGQNVTGSEDCLHLNVFTLKSQLNSTSLAPVMVFFHGVGFVAGQSDTYNPEYLVQKGVIVLTVQYRLGALGFLSSGDGLQPGNMGLMDQVEALKWVQKNIKYFGGDPDKVTLFGQSAGGVSVLLHLISPMTEGLFHGAIIESGTALAPYSIQKSPMTHVQRLAANLGCISGDTPALLDCIKFSDPKEVVASDAISIGSSSGSERKASRSHKKPPNPGPVVQFEGSDDWPIFLGDYPIQALKEGKFKKVPVVIGVTRDESASAVLNTLLPRLSNISESDPTYSERVFLKKVVKSSGFVNNTDFLRASIKFEYFKNYPLSDVMELKDEYISLHSDFSIVAPIYRTALLLSVQNPVFFYSFEYEGEHSFAEILSSAPDREPREPHSTKKRQLNEKEITEITPEVVEELQKLGGDALHLDEHNRYVIHGEELLYVFRFRNPSTGSVVDIEDEEGKNMREIMTTLWSNVAKFGEPTRNETNIVPWKQFSKDGPYTMKLTEKPSLLISYRHRKMLFWSHFLPQIENLEQSC